MKKTGVICAFFLSCLTACGNGGGQGSSKQVGLQSPGGLWSSLDSNGASVALWIAEDGTLLAQLSPDGQPFPSMGTGIATVTQADVLSGSFELGQASIPPAIPAGDGLACSVAGTLRQRQSMSVDIICADSNGTIYDESLTMSYQDQVYERASSLAALAGNYSPSFTNDPSTNFMSIASDGTITGMRNNGLVQCIITGTATIIDPDYTLIRTSWTLSGCTGTFGAVFEGAQLSGFSTEIFGPAGTPGSYLVMLAGSIQNGLYTISMSYNPV